MDANAVRENIFTFRTMAEARAIFKASGKASDGLMIGAGLVDLETGHAFEKKGKEVTAITKSNHLLSQNSDAGVALYLLRKRKISPASKTPWPRAGSSGAM